MRRPSRNSLATFDCGSTDLSKPHVRSVMPAEGNPGHSERSSDVEGLMKSASNAIHVLMSAERDWLVHEESGRELGHYPTRRPWGISSRASAASSSLSMTAEVRCGVPVPGRDCLPGCSGDDASLPVLVNGSSTVMGHSGQWPFWSV
jgi:hypothetical protein